MYKIAVIGGDGTGPEVIAEAIKTLEAIGKKHNIAYSFTELPITVPAISQKEKLFLTKNCSACNNTMPFCSALSDTQI